MKTVGKMVMLLYLLLPGGCGKEPYPGKVKILAVEDVTHASMVVKSSLEGAAEGEGLLVKGVCLDKSKIPVAESHHYEGINYPGSNHDAVTGISGLESGTRYVLRAYFETSAGIVYSDTLTVRTLPVDYLADSRDGKRYEVKLYGDQQWMLRNLDYATPGSRVFENKESNHGLFGRLYPYEEAVSACPAGWRLPTDADWKTLEQFIGVPPEDLDKTAERGSPFGGRMKEPGSRLWEISNTLSTNNRSGFSVVPSGYYNPAKDEFSYPRVSAQFWTRSDDSDRCFSRFFYAQSDEINRLAIDTAQSLLSVRCVK